MSITRFRHLLVAACTWIQIAKCGTENTSYQNQTNSMKGKYQE